MTATAIHAYLSLLLCTLPDGALEEQRPLHSEDRSDLGSEGVVEGILRKY